MEATASAAHVYSAAEASAVEPTASNSAYVTGTGEPTAVPATVKRMHSAAIGRWPSTTITAAVAVPGTVSVAAVVSIVAAAISAPVAGVSPAPTVPGASADKYAAYEPVRSVIAVRSASVRIIRIIAPRADRGTVGIRSSHNRRPDTNTDTYGDLCVGRRCERHH